MPPSRCITYFELFLTLIGIVVGSSGFVYYAFVLNCHISAILAFLSGVLASMCFHLHRLYLKDTMIDWYDSDHFNNMRLLSFIGTLIGCAFLIWTVFQQLYYDLPIDDISKNKVIPMVWSLLVTLWGSLLFIATKRYYSVTEEHQQLLTAPNRR